MMPPHYLQILADERQRELRRLARPFEFPSTFQALRGRLSVVLLRLGHALAMPDTPSPSSAISRAG